MNFNTYMELAQRTNSPLPTAQETLIHMWLGMITELGELADIFKKNIAYNREIDKVNVMEEVGDIFWYVAGFCKTVGVSEQDLIFTQAGGFEPIILIARIGSAINDLIAEVNLGKHRITINLSTIIISLLAIILGMGFTLDAVLDRNIAKLKVRYPEKFSGEQSENRQIKKEREVLEEW